MADTSDPSERRPGTETSERDELRTMSFRMREIQRLLSVRVEQENRRLEADGIDPVTETGFQANLDTGESTDE